MKMYCNICNNIENLKTLKCHISLKKNDISIVYSKCGHKKVFQQEESIEILKY